MSEMSEPEDPHPYSDLTPDRILDAVESFGVRCDGRITQLNSYENRVYQLGLDSGGLIVAKFYRPGRWPDAAILEEHEFAQSLRAEDLPVVPPQAAEDGSTLKHFGPHRVAIFPSIGGRPPALDRDEDLRQLGRLVARIHNLGATRDFLHRPGFEPGRIASQAVAAVQRAEVIPEDLREAWQALTHDLVELIGQRVVAAGEPKLLRLHGDCHPGNILWREDGPWLVDLDDTRMGPAIEDLWMFLSGDRDYQQARLAELLAGYSAFRDFDAHELGLVQALRSLRLLHFLGWIAERWSDPAFPRAFPDFGENRFWEGQILWLREEFAHLQEAPLEWLPESPY